MGVGVNARIDCLNYKALSTANLGQLYLTNHKAMNVHPSYADLKKHVLWNWIISTKGCHFQSTQRWLFHNHVYEF